METIQKEKVKLTAKVVSQEALTDDICSMWIQADEIAKAAKPGQFISVYTKDKSKVLPRPISLCEVDKEQGRLRIVYRVVGAGTREFSAYQAGDDIEIMGPLGNGFPLKEKKAFLIGGGIGIPPMLELAKNLNCEKQMVLGYRDVLFLNKEFEQYGGETIAISLVETIPDYSDCDDIFNNLEKYSWFIFTSANGVNIFFDRLKSRYTKTCKCQICRSRYIDKESTRKIWFICGFYTIKIYIKNIGGGIVKRIDR